MGPCSSAEEAASSAVTQAVYGRRTCCVDIRVLWWCPKPQRTALAVSAGGGKRLACRGTEARGRTASFPTCSSVSISTGKNMDSGYRLYRGLIRQDVYMSDGVGLLGSE